jgi:hypothetical protein
MRHLRQEKRIDCRRVPETLPPRRADLEVGIVPQGAPVDGLIRGILDMLGIANTPSRSDAGCLIDTRARAGKGGLAGSDKQAASVYFDDFIPIDLLLHALQGRPAMAPDMHLEPEFSVKARDLFKAICGHFWARGLPFVSKSFWPMDAPGCLVLTHDIDWFDYSPAHKAVSRGKSAPQFIGLLLRYATGKRFGPNIASTIQLEASFGVRSTFLFRNQYSSGQEKLAPAIRACQDSGCEVALHAAKKSHKNPAAMVKEKADIEKAVGGPVAGLREHALKFEYDKTWNCIEGAKFEYSMTYGLNEKTGFIGGVCHPYHPVALDGTPHSFWEIPTSFMDWTLVRAGMNFERIQDLIRQLRDSTARLNGCLCVNFHNTYIDKDLFPDIERAYRLLISECKGSGFWTATAKECADWWTRRERSPLEARVEDGSLVVDVSDPAVSAKVYWPDGKAELWGQARRVEGV